MNNKIIIGVVLIVMFVLLGVSIYKSRVEMKNAKADRETTINEVVQRPTETINAKYQYKNGQNVFVATLQLPTPCHKYSHSLTKADGIYEINFTTTESQEICAQVITERLVKIQWTGSPSDQYVAKLNGEVVNLNIFTIPDSENIDDIDIFIKA